MANAQAADNTADLIERLAQHKTLSAAPREELVWLAAHGTLRHVKEGDPLASKDVPISGMFVLLSGKVAIYIDRGAGRNKAMEWQAGDVTGVLPYSRVTNPPGDTMAQEPMEILELPRAQIPDLIHECPVITGILVHKMLDRARVFTSSSLHDEKMVSLGKLSAGLAHELNNPAAAIERGASLLEDRLLVADQAARALGMARLTDAQLAAVDKVRAACIDKTVQGVRSPIQQAEREDEFAQWLKKHGLDEATAEPLAETSASIEALDRVAETVSGPALDAVLRWTAAGCSVRGIASEIQEAAMRISGLVMAVKGFTHMDQATIAEPVDLVASLGNTVKVLKAKARSRKIAVEVTVAPGLPRVRGFAGELNQIWANLIDNALDAAPESGLVQVTAGLEKRNVVVRIIDNGAGIPADIRPRLFEPFVTSKPVGKGTGLGLDIVRRLVIHNDASIEVHSKPGRTEFRVNLELADQPAKAQA